jgi:acyl-CoA thioester hydrolase
MKRFFESRMGIYFDDLDSYKILHNARYILLFERCLGAFWMEAGVGALQGVESPDSFHLVRHSAIEYLSPVRGIGHVRVRVGIEKLGSTSLTFGFRMLPLDRDVDHARGTRTVVHVDPESLKPVPWPEAMRNLLAPWLNDAE